MVRRMCECMVMPDRPSWWGRGTWMRHGSIMRVTRWLDFPNVYRTTEKREREREREREKN